MRLLDKDQKRGMIQENRNHTNMVTAYIGIGANLGDRIKALQVALQMLNDLPEVRVTRESSVYETAPVGMTDQPEFLNAVVEVKTTLPALALLRALLDIENCLGRVRTLRWGPRVIDLDLLVYGTEQSALPELIVPHPRLLERAFVMVPLAEIAPELVLPGDTQTIKEQAGKFCSDGNIRCVGIV